MPPPTKAIFLPLGMVKPWPKGAKMSIFSPTLASESICVPSPLIWKTILSVWSVASHMDIGLRSVLPGTAMWANCPAFAFCASCGHSITKSKMPFAISSLFISLALHTSYFIQF